MKDYVVIPREGRASVIAALEMNRPQWLDGTTPLFFLNLPDINSMVVATNAFTEQDALDQISSDLNE